MHYLDKTLVGRSCVDVVFIVSCNSHLIDLVSSNPLDIFHAFASCSLPSPSLECCNLSLTDPHFVLEGNEG